MLLLNLIKTSTTNQLGAALEIVLTDTSGRNSSCEICGKPAKGFAICQGCIATELYARRKTMKFMALSLTVQAATCLIAKFGDHEARPAGPKQQLITSYTGEDNEHY